MIWLIRASVEVISSPDFGNDVEYLVDDMLVDLIVMTDSIERR